ncbi:MAG: hypothetical protein K0R99_2996 [Microbacterium sp.]|nr:hypothetical protein [Microbacterium sp.]
MRGGCSPGREAISEERLVEQQRAGEVNHLPPPPQRCAHDLASVPVRDGVVFRPSAS